MIFFPNYIHYSIIFLNIFIILSLSIYFPNICIIRYVSFLLLHLLNGTMLLKINQCSFSIRRLNYFPLWSCLDKYRGRIRETSKVLHVSEWNIVTKIKQIFIVKTLYYWRVLKRKRLVQYTRVYNAVSHFNEGIHV